MCGSNPVSQVVSTVSNSVNSAVSAVSNGVNNVLQQGADSDPGKFVSNVAGSAADVAKAPIEIAYDVSRGDIEHAQLTAKRGVAGGANLASGGALYLASTDAGKTVLTNPYARALTFEASNDYYETGRGFQDMKSTGNMSQNDFNSTLRFGSKAAAVAGGVAYFGAPTGTQAGTLFASGKSLERGDLLGAVTGVAGLNGVTVPDWAKPLLPTGPSRSPAGTPEPSVSSPWRFADSGLSGGQQAGVSVVLLVGIVAGIYLLKKKGVI